MVNTAFANRAATAHSDAMTAPPALFDIADPDRVLALAYVPARHRGAMTALFALDERLGGIVATTREPAIGLMRLLWWRDALERLDDAPPPAEPLLTALASVGVSGVVLGAMTAGWEALLDDPDCGDETIASHAAERGERLFAVAAAMLSGASPPAGAGAGWATVDLARRLGRPAIAASAVAPLARALSRRWPRPLRPLGQLAALALADARGATGPRRRALRVIRHQLTGR